MNILPAGSDSRRKRPQPPQPIGLAVWCPWCLIGATGVGGASDGNGDCSVADNDVDSVPVIDIVVLGNVGKWPLVGLSPCSKQQQRHW